MRRTCPILFFALLILLAFWKPLFHPEFTLLTGGDMAAQTYPWFSVAAHWLRKGTLLLWDPYVYSGKAALGELQPGILYPLNWVFFLLPAADGNISPQAIQGLILLHYFMAGLFSYYLARSFDLSGRASVLAGTVFALGGYMTQVVGYVNIFSGFCWMPLSLLGFRRALPAGDFRRRLRWILVCGASLGMALLAGHHVPPIHTGLLLMFYGAFRALRMWRAAGPRPSLSVAAILASAAGLAALLTAMQWLPSMQWARRVVRYAGPDDPIAWGEKIPYSVLEKTGNVSPQAALSFLLGRWTPDSDLYVGLGVALLAIVALLFVRHSEARFFGGATLLYFFASWGEFSALHGWANTFIPGLWFAREVFHYLVPFQLCLALTAAWGLDFLIASYPRGSDLTIHSFVRRIGWGLALLVLAAGVLIAGAVLWAGLPLQDVRLARLSVLAAYAVVIGVVLFLLHAGRVSPYTASALLIIVVTVDLTSHVSQGVLRVDRPRGAASPAVAAYWSKSEAAERLLSLRAQEVFRVDDPQTILPENFGDAWRLEATMGHGATGLARYLDFRRMGWGPGSNASALLNAKYLVSRAPIPWLEQVMPGDAAIYRNSRALPRVFVASQYRALDGDAEILAWLATPLMALREEVLIARGELQRCNPEFLKEARAAASDVRIRDVHFRTAAEIEAEELLDQSAKEQLHAYHAPWGWTAGDEIAVRFSPAVSGMRCFMIIRYVPLGQSESILNVRHDAAGNTRQIAVRLPATQAVEETDSIRQHAVDLGELDAREHRISFVKTAECAARLESLAFTSGIGLAPQDSQAGKARLTSLKPNTVRVEAELPRASFVVLSELMYPGWDAWVDGERTPVLTGNYMFRAIPVPAGKHKIVLRFRSTPFLLGLTISAATLLAAGLAITRARR
jgi:hypothetical protein